MKIVVNLFLLFLSITAATASQLPDEDGLWLVVGSCRSKETVNIWWQKISGSETDFTHEKTFGGKAVTLDSLPCKRAGLPHLQENARTFKPSSPIKAVYMELFPSIDVNRVGASYATGTGQEKIDQMTLMPATICNLAAYMVAEAPLTIEHIPHFSCLEGAPYAQSSSAFKTLNPFSCFLSPVFMEDLEASMASKGKIEPNFNDWERIIQQRRGPSFDAFKGYFENEWRHDHPFFLEAFKNIQIFAGLEEEPFQRRLHSEIIKYKSFLKTSRSYAEALAYMGFEESLSAVIAQEVFMLTHKPLMIELRM